MPLTSGTFGFCSKTGQLACIRSKGSHASVLCALRNECPGTREPSPKFPAVGLARSGHPSAGGWLTAGCPRTKFKNAQNALAFAAIRQTGNMKPMPKLCEALAPSMPRQLHLPAVEQRARVRPNPSIERTSTGLAHFAPQVYVPLRGPSRFRPAHVKR
jgi:hypothetical protein